MNCECGKEATYHGPDPYASEINDDYTEVDLCADCYYDSVGDI